MTDELRMTLICPCCSNQYGKWRPQCPACGTPRPEQKTERVEAKDRRLDDMRRIKQRRADAREKKKLAKECIVCRRGGAKLKCPHCEEKIHKGCLSLHADDCAAFQVSLKECYKKHGLSV